MPITVVRYLITGKRHVGHSPAHVRAPRSAISPAPLDRLTQGTATEGAVGVPAQQVVNRIIAEGGADSSAAAPDVYVMSSTEFMRGLQDVLGAAVQEIVEDLRVEREEETRAALTAVVLTVAVVGLLAVLVTVLTVVLLVLASRRRSAAAPGVRG
jgi:hypothetical protein